MKAFRCLQFGVVTVFTALIVTASPAQILGEAPFGLKWGLSAAEVLALGVGLEDKSDGEYGTDYLASRLPKTLSDVEHVILQFGSNDRLWRIVAASREFPNDPYGTKLLSRYDELEQILAEKYGPGTLTHEIDKDLWKDPDEFLMGVLKGRSWHYTTYKSEPVAIELSVRATDADSGYYVIIYKHLDLSKEHTTGKSAKEKGAL